MHVGRQRRDRSVNLAGPSSLVFRFLQRGSAHDLPTPSRAGQRAAALDRRAAGARAGRPDAAAAGLSARRHRRPDQPPSLGPAGRGRARRGAGRRWWPPCGRGADEGAGRRLDAAADADVDGDAVPASVPAARLRRGRSGAGGGAGQPGLRAWGRPGGAGVGAHAGRSGRLGARGRQLAARLRHAGAGHAAAFHRRAVRARRAVHAAACRLPRRCAGDARPARRPAGGLHRAGGRFPAASGRRRGRGAGAGGGRRAALALPARRADLRRAGARRDRAGPARALCAVPAAPGPAGAGAADRRPRPRGAGRARHRRAAGAPGPAGGRRRAGRAGRGGAGRPRRLGPIVSRVGFTPES